MNERVNVTVITKTYYSKPLERTLRFEFTKKCSQFHCTGLLRSSELVHIGAKNLALFTQNLV